MSNFITIINIVLEVLATTVREEKKEKEFNLGKEVKLLLFADDMVLYIEHPENVTTKALLLLNEYGKFARYKIDTQKLLAFLYTPTKKPIFKECSKPNILQELPYQNKQLNKPTYNLFLTNKYV